MIGLGETFSEIKNLMDDLRFNDVDFITIGQYLGRQKITIQSLNIINLNILINYMRKL